MKLFMAHWKMFMENSFNFCSTPCTRIPIALISQALIFVVVCLAVSIWMSRFWRVSMFNVQTRCNDNEEFKLCWWKSTLLSKHEKLLNTSEEKSIKHTIIKHAEKSLKYAFKKYYSNYGELTAEIKKNQFFSKQFFTCVTWKKSYVLDVIHRQSSVFMEIL